MSQLRVIDNVSCSMLGYGSGFGVGVGVGVGVVLEV
jgi:hypothetical protein